MEMFGLTPKEIIMLRTKCLEPFITIASKANIDQDTIIKKAEVAWNYAIAPLLENEKKPSGESQSSNDSSKPAVT